jgi:hypothetical protein
MNSTTPFPKYFGSDTKTKVYNASDSIPPSFDFQEDGQVLVVKGRIFDDPVEIFDLRPLDSPTPAFLAKRWRDVALNDNTVNEFKRTLCADVTIFSRIHGERGPAKPHSTLDIGNITDAIFQFSSAIDMATKGRRLIRTQGHLGLGPRDAQIGDKVTILRGSQTPLLLTRASPTGWNVVGKVYVDCMMDGEIVVDGYEIEIRLR